jgi:hypothetical protein
MNLQGEDRPESWAITGVRTTPNGMEGHEEGTKTRRYEGEKYHQNLALRTVSLISIQVGEVLFY